MHFVTTGASSLLALVMAVVFHFKTTASIPDELATAFKRICLNIYLDASADEIVMMRQLDNFESHEHHAEIDNIWAVDGWMQSMRELESSLKPNDGLDVFLYGLCLWNPRQPWRAPKWMVQALAGKLPTMANRVAVVTAKYVTKRWIKRKRAFTRHPQLKSFHSVTLRHRFLRGFCAFRDLYQLLYCRMGLRARNQDPISKAGP